MIVSGDDLFKEAAEIFAASANEAVERSGAFNVALSGGSTPKRLYELLARDYGKRIPWDRTHVFFDDERVVPPDSPESNYGMARDVMLEQLPIPSDNIHRMMGELDPESAAEEYTRELMDHFNLEEHEIPTFDLILLGMGEDGHTASIFPGSAVLHETNDLVAAPFVDKLGVDRLTLTPPVLTHARKVLALVTGENKKDALREVLEGGFNPERYPAQLLRRSAGEVIWLVDPPAASALKR